MSGRLSVSTFATRLGWMALVESREAVVRLTFGHETPQLALRNVAALLDEGMEPTGTESPLAKRLEAFAEGETDDFSDVDVRPRQRTPFCSNVIKHCRRIGYGQTMTYGELAEVAGNPRAAPDSRRAAAAWLRSRPGR